MLRFVSLYDANLLATVVALMCGYGPAPAHTHHRR